MKTRNRLIAALIATTVALGSAGAPAYAAGPDQKRQTHEQSSRKAPQAQRAETHKRSSDTHFNSKNANRNASKKHDTRRAAERQKTPSWRHRGGKMPGHRSAAKVDHRKHRLGKPPAGHQWVRADDTYVLVGITTGIIASIIAANR